MRDHLVVDCFLAGAQFAKFGVSMVGLFVSGEWTVSRHMKRSEGVGTLCG